RGLADVLDLAEIELTLFAEETTQQRLVVLGPALRPAASDARHLERDGVAVVPLDLQLRLHLTHQGEQPGQQGTVPVEFPARREALLAEVPALAVSLPRHHVFRLGPQPRLLFVEGGICLPKERAEGWRVDLAELVDLHDDGLPRPLVVRRPDARLVAVDFQ